MFGRLFRGKPRAPRPDARTGGQPASPYAPLFEEAVLSAPAEVGEPPDPAVLAIPEPLVEPPAPPSEPPPVPLPELVEEPALPPPAPSAPLPREPPLLLEEPLLRPAVPYPMATPGVDAATEQASPARAADNGAAAAVEPLSAEEHAAILGVMRVAPDIRYRAARSAGLLGGLEDVRGAALEHAILERARAAGKLAELAEATSR